MIKKLTLVKCGCGYASCDIYGFAEGMFHWGTGFPLKDAKEIAKRYNSYVPAKKKGKKKK